MYRSLYFKIILIFVVFMITVMAVVGPVLLNSVFSFYTRDFVGQLDGQLGEGAPVLSARKFNSEMERHPDWFDRKSTSSGFMIYWGLKLKEVL